MTQGEKEKYWRVRMRVVGEQLEKTAWERGEVGIWYGGWTGEDLKEAIDHFKADDARAAKYLSELPHHRERVREYWSRPTIEPSSFRTAKRFYEIKEGDWVYIYFGDALHLAKVCSEVGSSEDHALNRKGELFKFRRIRQKKSFRLSHLPDSFLLLPSAGRGNVYEVHGTYRRLVGILAQCADEGEARTRIEQLPFKEWLRVIGPSAWESLCLGFLIVTEGFLPTGLHVGGTLKTFDIVGRASNGEHVLAQCKKSESPVPLDSNFVEACASYQPRPKAYYFAYGGCTKDRTMPPWVRLVTGEDIQKWFREDGQQYARLLQCQGQITTEV